MLEGRTIIHRFTLGGVTMEDENKVHKWRRFLPPTPEGERPRGQENKGLIQFWAVKGGLRTIDVSNIIRIEGKAGSAKP